MDLRLNPPEEAPGRSYETKALPAGVRENFSFENTLVLGMEHGEACGGLSPHLVFAVGPQGEIVVLDRDRKKLCRFSPEGGLVWSTGKRGEGPGEFRYPMGVFVTPQGRVWVLDHGGVVHEFSPEGEFRRDIFVDFTAGEFYFTEDERVLATLFSRGACRIRAAFYDLDLEFISAFPFEYEYQCGPGPGRGWRMEYGKVTLCGRRVLFALPDKYEVLVFNYDGDLLLKVKREVEFHPTRFENSGGGAFALIPGDHIGPAFYVKGGKYAVQFKTLRGKFYEPRIDLYDNRGRFLASRTLLPYSSLRWVDKEGNFYFLQTQPAVKIYRAKLRFFQGTSGP